MIPRFKCKITKGSFSQSDFENKKMLTWISGQPNGDYWLTLKKDLPDRSWEQQKYYCGCVLEIISAETGQDKNEVHEFLLSMFAPRIEIEIMGDKIETIKRTSTKNEKTCMNTKEYTDYIERIRRWSLEFLNCYIPDPNEVEY